MKQNNRQSLSFDVDSFVEVTCPLEMNHKKSYAHKDRLSVAADDAEVALISSKSQGQGSKDKGEIGLIRQ